MLKLLLFLLKRGAHLKPIPIKTKQLGEHLKMSQQNASIILRKALQKNLINKKGEGFILTEKSLNKLYFLYLTLKEIFSNSSLIIEGEISKGLGEGKYYLSFSEYTEQIKEKLGFYPYPGTLNIKLSKQSALKKEAFLSLREPIVINGFERDGRKFGGLNVYRCNIEGIEGAIVVPHRTHHSKKIVELIAPFCLLEKLGKKIGDKLKVTIY